MTAYVSGVFFQRVLPVFITARGENPRKDGKRIAGGWDRKRIAAGHQTDCKRIAELDKSF